MILNINFKDAVVAGIYSGKNISKTDSCTSCYAYLCVTFCDQTCFGNIFMELILRNEQLIWTDKSD